jgi:uncharacterized protein YndB with AHSA1/START domain
VPYTFTLTTTIPASAQDIYDAWLDSAGHSEMTGGEASMSDQIGTEVSAADGYISGRNLELVPGERIVQSWRTTEFTDDHEDSIITVTLEEVDGETLLTLIHSNVPDGQTSYQRGGWQEHYFEPMIEYFTALNRVGKDESDEDDEGGEEATAPAPATEREPAAPKRGAKPAREKPKPTAAPKGTAAATAKPKRAKKAKAKAKLNTKSKSGPKSKSKLKSKPKVKSKAKAKPKSKSKTKPKSKSKSKTKAKAARRGSGGRRR